jgi:lipoate-protein ligase B
MQSSCKISAQKENSNDGVYLHQKLCSMVGCAAHKGSSVHILKVNLKK